MLLAFHVQHNIHNVLQHLGACNVPRLGHMAHQKDGDVVLLGNVQQGRGTLSHLHARIQSNAKPLDAFTSLNLQQRVA